MRYTIAMESFIKSDVFFFVTTICVCVVTALIIIVLTEVIRILRDVRSVSDKIAGEANRFVSDFTTVHATLRESQFGLRPIIEAIKKFAEKFSLEEKGKTKKKKENGNGK